MKLKTQNEAAKVDKFSSFFVLPCENKNPGDCNVTFNSQTEWELKACGETSGAHSHLGPSGGALYDGREGRETDRRCGQKDDERIRLWLGLLM